MRGRNKQSISEVAKSEFNAKFLFLLDKVNKTKAPLPVTRRGKAIADVIPPVGPQRKGTGLVRCPATSKSPATSFLW